MPTSCPRNGLKTGVEVPGPSRCPTVWPLSTRTPSSMLSRGRNTPTDGAMIIRSGTRSPSPWVKRASMELGDLQLESDVIGCCDVADGDGWRAPLGQCREHRAVADLQEGGGAETDQCVHRRAPLNGNRDVLGEPGAPAVGIVVRHR